MDILFNIAAFLVAISILVAVHEFGHFWVARRLGVKVLRFSIGFGRPLLKRTGKDGTEYVIAALPLGGYVKMLGEHDKTELSEEEKHLAHDNQSVYKRFAIAFAGPLFNLVFAVFIYWGMYTTGVQGIKPIVGEVESQSPVALSGILQGDQIISVNGKQTPIWQEVTQTLLPALIEDNKVSVEVKGTDGYNRKHEISLQPRSGELKIEELFKELGLKAYVPNERLVISQFVKDSPAENAGLQVNDQILEIDRIEIKNWDDLTTYLSSKPDSKINILVKRKDKELEFVVHTASVKENGKNVGKIKAHISSLPEFSDDMIIKYRYSILDSLGKSLSHTWDSSIFTLKMFGKMLSGELSIKNLSGPINIAVIAGYSARSGYQRFLEFLALVSISLGIINLLPIPVLDGGHLMFYLIEMVKGSPVSDTVMDIAFRIGIFIIVLLMSIVFYNDIIRLIG